MDQPIQIATETIIQMKSPFTVPTHASVVSLPDGNGGEKAYLRLEDVTLPIVHADKQHRSFILSTWVKSAMPLLRKRLNAPDDTLRTEEGRYAEAAWDRAVLITGADDEFTVHAWVCGGPGRLDYAYVPPGLRRKGIASALIAHVCGSDYEYSRPWPFKGGLPGTSSYNPYLLGRM